MTHPAEPPPTPGPDGPGAPPLVAVILAGGAGTRFWPASTADNPKQFLTLTGDRSLLQLSYDRMKDLVPPERTFVITAERFVGTVRRHLPELPAENVVGEPMRRDTAAAVALATCLVHARFGPATLAVVTADHVIGPPAAFQEALRVAAAHARPGKSVVTFGIAPTSPATGYGYLEVGPALGTDAGASVHPVTSFHEKPDLATAERYVSSGRFLWNSGMFVFATDYMRETLRRLLPAHADVLEPLVAGGASPSASALRGAFERLPSVSVDKGVMEKLEGTLCVRGTFSWSDVGGFPALAAHLPHDDAKNAVRGQLRAREATGNIVWSEDDTEVVALVGVSGLCVVRAGKRTLVVPIERAEEIKKLVEALPPDEQ